MSIHQADNGRFIWEDDNVRRDYLETIGVPKDVLEASFGLAKAVMQGTREGIPGEEIAMDLLEIDLFSNNHEATTEFVKISKAAHKSAEQSFEKPKSCGEILEKNGYQEFPPIAIGLFFNFYLQLKAAKCGGNGVA